MSTEVKQSAALKGGEWLIKESSPFETFIPKILPKSNNDPRHV